MKQPMNIVAIFGKKGSPQDLEAHFDNN